MEHSAKQHNTTEYSNGLHEVGDGCFAWLQPDGGWGWSNAGLVVGDGVSLLIDTLFDVPLTRTMLNGMRSITDTHPIATVCNTHANGDHWFGNELLAGREIIASSATATEMPEVLPPAIEALRSMPGPTGDFVREIFKPFDWSEFSATLPNRTFDGQLDIDVGGVAVRLIEVGPAHTRGDTIAYVPSTGTIYSGDILFIDGTPIVWAGPLSNWVAACDAMLQLDADVVVPGHGPVTDNDGIRAVRDYLSWVDSEARARHAAGMSLSDAVADMADAAYRDLPEHGRIAPNVLAVYRELEPGIEGGDVVSIFADMAAIEGYGR